jgi:hypothetical protein
MLFADFGKFPLPDSKSLLFPRPSRTRNLTMSDLPRRLGSVLRKLAATKAPRGRVKTYPFTTPKGKAKGRRLSKTFGGLVYDDHADSLQDSNGNHTWVNWYTSKDRDFRPTPVVGLEAPPDHWGTPEDHETWKNGVRNLLGQALEADHPVEVQIRPVKAHRHLTDFLHDSLLEAGYVPDSKSMGASGGQIRYHPPESEESRRLLADPKNTTKYEKQKPYFDGTAYSEGNHYDPSITYKVDL